MEKIIKNLKNKETWKQAFKVSLALFVIKEIVGVILMMMGLV